MAKSKIAICSGAPARPAQLFHARVSSPAVSYYFQRFGFCDQQIMEAPHPNLGITVVVPSYNEPNLLASLESLWRCDRPDSAVEVIVVINSSEASPPEVLEQNLRSLREAASWTREDCDRHFRVHLLHFPNLPRKHAGVGLARKIGMDEALRRFDAAGRLDGVIVCFDADSTCDPNYLVEVEKFFRANPKSPGCSIYFEHPLEFSDTTQRSQHSLPSAPSALSASSASDFPSAGAASAEISKAITLYELHLRYYVQALRFAGFPHAFHTIGSSMAVRAGAYMKQGGMNKRHAGEDFYFLHKIIPLGHFGEVNTTRVIPSPRPSDRVPFGTGRAVRDFLASGKFATYPLQAFQDLKTFFSAVPDLFLSSEPAPLLSEPLQNFLAQQDFRTKLAEIREHTSTPESFRNRFFRWFDGFVAMKYIHFARDAVYGAAEIGAAAGELLRSDASNPRELLLQYRGLQRNNLPFRRS